MIAGLVKRGEEGGQTGADELGAKMRSACPKCKRVAWTAEVMWVNTDTMGWKALGERPFEREIG